MEFFGLGPLEVLLIALIAFIVFGPEKAPEIGRKLGEAVREFRRTSSQMTHQLTREVDQVKESLPDIPDITIPLEPGTPPQETPKPWSPPQRPPNP